MKIALDENVLPQMVTVFQALANGRGGFDVEICLAKDYRPDGERGDEHWTRRFAADGGQVIISGDTRMWARLHELAALVESDLVTYFFQR